MGIETKTLLLMLAAQPVVDLQDKPSPPQALPLHHQDQEDSTLDHHALDHHPKSQLVMLEVVQVFSGVH